MIKKNENQSEQLLRKVVNTRIKERKSYSNPRHKSQSKQQVSPKEFEFSHDFYPQKVLYTEVDS